MGLASDIAIFCDFDGTITSTDSLKYLLRTYGGSAWLQLEWRLMRGEVSERQALVEAFSNFSLSSQQMKDVIEAAVKVDSGFESFADWVRSEGIEFTILSGGFESIIDQVFEREAWPRFPRLANGLVVDEKGWTLRMLSKSPSCGRCSHCKGDTLRRVRRQNSLKKFIYIGDGISDICAIQVADFVLAKGFLADYCEKRSIPHVRFEHFNDVRPLVEAFQSWPPAHSFSAAHVG